MPYSMVGFMAVCNAIPFSLTETFLSHNTPDTPLHFFLISLPFLSTSNPKYLYSYDLLGYIFSIKYHALSIIKSCAKLRVFCFLSAYFHSSILLYFSPRRKSCSNFSFDLTHNPTFFIHRRLWCIIVFVQINKSYDEKQL